MTEDDADNLESEGTAPSKGLPVDLQALAVGLWQWRWWFMGTLAAAVVLGLGAGKMLATRTFTAETLLLYQAPAPGSPEESTMPSLLTLLNMVKLPSQLEAVASRLGVEADNRMLGGATSVEVRPKTTLVVIRAKWDSPRRAADIANTLRDVFLESQTKLRREDASSRVKDLESRLVAVSEQLSTAEQALGEFTRANRIIHLSEESRTMLEELATLNLLYEQARIDQQSVRIQAENTESIIRELREEMAKEQQAEAALSDALSETNIRIQRLREGIMDDKDRRYNEALLEEARLKFARTQKLVELGAASEEALHEATAELRSLEARAVDTPEIEAMRLEIEELDKSVVPQAGASGGMTGNLLKDVMFRSFEIRLQETTVAERVNSLAEAKSRVEERIERLPDLQRTFAQLTRDVASLETEKGLLIGRLGEARRLYEASALPFTLVSAAEPPPRSSTSNARPIAAGVAALILGSSWVTLLGLVLLDPRVRTRRELEIAMGGNATVLGSIPGGDPQAYGPPGGEQPAELVEAFREAARHFRTRYPGTGVRVLLCSPGYGEGTSAAALNLAAVLGRWGERVLIVDAQPDEPVVAAAPTSRLRAFVNSVVQLGVARLPVQQDECLYSLAADKITIGLLDLLEQPDRPLEEAVVPLALPNVWMVPQSGREGSRDLLGSELFRRRLAQASERYSVVLVVAPPVLTSQDAESCALGAEEVLLVVRAMGAYRPAVASAAARLARVGRAPTSALLTATVPPFGPRVSGGMR